MEMLKRSTIAWTLVFLGLEIATANAIDIGYSCTEDSECQKGNGGSYSKCSDQFHLCVCTLNKNGEEVFHSMQCNYLACVIMESCNNSSPTKVLFRWLENEDWYGIIPAPFTSIFIQDNVTSVCYDPDRALHSVPKGFVVKNSTIPGAGLGVFTDQYIERDTVIGPYKGILEPDSDTANESGYSWTLRKDSVRKQTIWIDAKYKHLSNWLRYVNMPNSAEEENLVAIQYRGEMYYRVFKPIPQGTELRVQYGESYARLLKLKSYQAPVYYYGREEYAGGECYSLEGKNCAFDLNTICVDGTCLCRPGSYFRYGECITDGALGGRCFGDEGEACNKDVNAECHRGTCVCRINATAVNNVCVLDETFGGHCAGKDGEDCLGDKNAECVNGICNCKYLTTANSKKVCIKDEMVGGRCNGEDLEACALDPNALCEQTDLNKICFCRCGTSQVGELCVEDEAYGGRCFGKNNSICLIDTGALCRNGVCVCPEKASPVNGRCKQVERLGGRCEGATGWPCKLEKHAVCINHVCKCEIGYSEAHGTCVKDGHLGGMCDDGDCHGENTVCDFYDKCVCKTGLKQRDGKCVKT